jgi:hypothetical protein
MAYSKAKLKSNGDKASPYFKPFWTGKLSDKCLSIRILLYVSVKHILIGLTNLRLFLDQEIFFRYFN